MVRETVGAGAGVSAPLELVCTVVAVWLVVYDGVWVCADARAATAKKPMARDSFFTMVLDLGEKEISNHLYGAG